MHRFIPSTEEDKREMLKTIGAENIEALFVDIPKEVRLEGDLDLEMSKSELEVSRIMHETLGKNRSTNDLVCFLGAGAYDHYVPSVVNHLSSRQEFATAYTPYQPEISQGTLQVIFEFQTMIAELTGMEVANASMYDGPTACAEAAAMAIASGKKKNKIVVSETVHPEVINVLKTYMRYSGAELVIAPMKDGETDYEALAGIVDDGTAGVLVQNPNFFGVIEDVKRSVDIAHDKKALAINYVDPIALSVLEAPGKLGFDIVVGDGQGLGNDLHFGGPYVGFFASSQKLVRKMPGRICGESVDSKGRRAFVLTLQAREQHIRRYKANSNICSNQGLIALRATIYMSTMGKQGMQEVAKQCLAKSHYAAKKLTESGKYKLAFDKPFFKEFALVGERSAQDVNAKLLENNILGGYDLGDLGVENGALLCFTEKRTKAEIDQLASVLEVL
ncbi:MAG: aminomethyl-transferring glycine dehydrogenase subunit GcvPA [Clostridia bacterium]|nr:aminomethyl-transferring glycine dehydrogenase subunit GcvPA [Clostridia bacterium]